VQAINRRVGLLFGVFALILFASLLRAGWLQVVKSGDLQAQAREQQVAEVEVPGLRGRVLDRRGRPLALSEDAVDVVATPYQIEDPAMTAARLSPYLDESPTDISESISDPESGFAYVSQGASLFDGNEIEDLDLPGITTLPTSRRVYPQGAVAAHVIGAVGSENQGLTGLEAGQQSVLGATDGSQEIVYDARGYPLRFETSQEASMGADIQLTLDSSIQAKAEAAVTEVAERYSAKSAAAVVMNPNTGDVLAMASWPGFDPKDLSKATNEDLLNRPTGYTYEPGSTFKAFTVAGALEDGVVSPSSSFTLAPKIKVYDRVIGESHPRPTMTMSVSEILAQSSNVGAVTIGLEHGADRFSQWVDRFGFGRQTGIEFPAEERGIVPERDEYSGSSMGNLPIGQGLSVTPIQMASAYSAIANGGKLLAPRLVESVDGSPTTPAHKPERIISESTAASVREMLKGVVEAGGTAAEVSVPNYTLAGKTGTAEKAEDGGYSETRYVASFVGFAPADNPQLVIAVLVDEPKYETSGGKVAAPVVADIASFALPYLGIAPG
jgi:cell division protein FtsI/penicillin-binding protein 2